MSEENDTGKDEEETEENAPEASTGADAGKEQEPNQEDTAAKDGHDAVVPVEESPEKPAGTPAIEAGEDELLDAIKSQATDIKQDEIKPETAGEKDAIGKPGIKAGEDEILDEIKHELPGEKEAIEKLGIKADEDEILDEIKHELPGEKEGIEKPGIEASKDEILDEIKHELPGEKEAIEKLGIKADDDEILDEIKHELPGEKEAIEKLGIIADEDEILDEIRPKSAETKQVDPEQYKKDFNRNQVEAVLFVSGQAVSAEEISVKLSIPKKQVDDLLERLAMEYLERSTALEIAKIADKYILQLKPEFTSHVKSFAAGGLIREAVMRTLTIIAAKQPILQSDLSKIRSSAGEHLKELLDMGLIKKTPKGRSSDLTTTDKFADMFGFSRDVAKMKEQIKIYLTAATKDEE